MVRTEKLHRINVKSQKKVGKYFLWGGKPVTLRAKNLSVNIYMKVGTRHLCTV